MPNNDAVNNIRRMMGVAPEYFESEDGPPTVFRRPKPLRDEPWSPQLRQSVQELERSLSNPFDLPAKRNVNDRPVPVPPQPKDGDLIIPRMGFA